MCAEIKVIVVWCGNFIFLDVCDKEVKVSYCIGVVKQIVVCKFVFVFFFEFFAL